MFIYAHLTVLEVIFIIYFFYTAIDQDEEDIFQCGKCKSQFTSLHLFVLHKREHTKVQEQTVDLCQYLVSNDSHVVQTDDNCQDGTQYNPEDDFNQTHQLGEPIILEENDILFSMDQEGASYLTSDSSFHVPIILNTDGLENFANTSITGTDDDHLLHEEVNELQALENDPNQQFEEDENDPIQQFEEDENDPIQQFEEDENDLEETINSDIAQIENFVDGSEQEHKSGQTQNLKVDIIKLHTSI